MASKKPSGLGRGLGALLGDDVMKTESSGSLSLPISQVETCSSQPRKRFDDESLQELADSISQHGIIQPLTVRKLSSGYYQIIAGERRWRAARLAGLQEVPVIVIEADDRKAAELAMIENLQREDLNPMEEAAGFQSLIESYHMTQEEAAQRVGKSRSAVTNALRLLGLTPSVRKLVEEGYLGATPIRHFVTGVSAGIVDEQALLDLQYSEDSRAMVDLNCVMNELGEIIELQGTGEGRAFTAREQQELVELCAKGCRELIRKEKDILGEVL